VLHRERIALFGRFDAPKIAAAAIFSGSPRARTVDIAIESCGRRNFAAGRLSATRRPKELTEELDYAGWLIARRTPR